MNSKPIHHKQPFDRLHLFRFVGSTQKSPSAACRTSRCACLRISSRPKYSKTTFLPVMYMQINSIQIKTLSNHIMRCRIELSVTKVCKYTALCKQQLYSSRRLFYLLTTNVSLTFPKPNHHHSNQYFTGRSLIWGGSPPSKLSFFQSLLCVLSALGCDLHLTVTRNSAAFMQLGRLATTSTFKFE